MFEYGGAIARMLCDLLERRFTAASSVALDCRRG